MELRLTFLLSCPDSGLATYLLSRRGANVAELQVSRSVRLGAGEELKGSSICCVDYCEEGMFPFVLVFTSSVFIALSVQLSFVRG